MNITLKNFYLNLLLTKPNQLGVNAILANQVYVNIFEHIHRVPSIQDVMNGYIRMPYDLADQVRLAIKSG